MGLGFGLFDTEEDQDPPSLQPFHLFGASGAGVGESVTGMQQSFAQLYKNSSHTSRSRHATHNSSVTALQLQLQHTSKHFWALLGRLLDPSPLYPRQTLSL